MSSCACVPPLRLHVRPDGVHLPDGSPGTIVVVDEVWVDGHPNCSVCAEAIASTFFRCATCATLICRACLGMDTLLVECDCDLEVAVTGVQLAARRAAARVS